MKKIKDYFKEHDLHDCHRGRKLRKSTIHREKISRGNKYNPHHVKWNIEKQPKKAPLKTHEQKVYMLTMRYNRKPIMAGEQK